MFEKEIYVERRKVLCNEMKKGIGIFLGNDDSTKDTQENYYSFVQDSTFVYYFGLKREGLVGIIDFSTGESYLSGKDYSVNDTVWMGDQPSILEMGKEIGVEKFVEIDELKKFLEQKVASQKWDERDEENSPLLYAEPYRERNGLRLSELLNISYFDVAKKYSLRLKKAIIKQRNIKTEREILEIEKAVNITREMHLKAYEVVKAGVYEYEVKAEVEKIAAMHGCTTSFQTITTIHGETLHNRESGNMLKDGDLFLLDCGAKLENGYCGDMTSVIPVSGKFSEKQKECYELLIDMYNKGVSTLKVGVKYREAYIESSRVLIEGLKKIGLIHGNTDEMLEKSVQALFFPHGLGHMLGLDGHDCEALGEDYVGYAPGETRDTRAGYRSLRLSRALEEGFVFTVEPGIYFIPKLIDQWEREGRCSEYLNFEKIREYIEVGGMRYESDYAVTKDGVKRLGGALPKSVEEVESRSTLCRK